MSGRIVVLASGGGTNCQALIDACANGTLDAAVVAVVTNRAEAGVITRAEASGIDWHHVQHIGKTADERRESDQRLIEVVQDLAPDLVVLAGWMRILGAEVGAAFPMINLHPARPGQFPGLRAIERAFDAWSNDEIEQSGVMVHWVPDEGVDVGPVICTETVRFEPGDTLETFSTRMHTCEHRLIVQAAETALREVAVHRT